MTPRPFTGTILKADGVTPATGVLRVEIVEPGPVDGGTVVLGTMLFGVQDGVIVGRSTGEEDATLPSPANLRFSMSAAGREVFEEFEHGIAESDDEITWGAIYNAAHVPVDVSNPVGGVTSHSDLTDLDADDHPQYHTNARGDARYSPLGHTHTDKADLVGGVVPTAQLPSLAITDTFSVASQVAMLALAAQKGDVAVRTDLSKSFILAGTDPTVLANWTELSSPGAVTSVNSQTGVVVLGAADVGAASTAALATEVTNRTNADTANADAITAETNARILADSQIMDGVTRLMIGMEGVYDLDAMPDAYDGPETWGAKVQWIGERIIETDDGDPTERHIVFLFGDGVKSIGDETDMPFQEEGILGTYGIAPNTWGTRYGACTQILLPSTGALADSGVVSIDFRAKTQPTMIYSVVNGNPVHILQANAVLESTATPPAGEGGNYSMIGFSRATSSYAGLGNASVEVRFSGVGFRTKAGSGLTAFDASHCFSVDVQSFIADVDKNADEIDDYDPRMIADGTPFDFTVHDNDDEIEERKRSAGLWLPDLWNGAVLNIAQVQVQGYRNGLVMTEHTVLLNGFFNYCVAGVKLRGMSHRSSVFHTSFQRCRRWYEAPQSNDWDGRATTALIRVYAAGGEAYHPGEYGNPVGNKWYNHETRIWDPDGLIKGDINIYESPAEQSGTHPTLLPGHGANLVVSYLGDPTVEQVDVTPAMTVLTPVSGVVTIPTDQGDAERAAWYEVKIDEDPTEIAIGALRHGQRIRLHLKHSGTALVRSITVAADYTLHTVGTLETGEDDMYEVWEIESSWTSSPTKKIITVSILPDSAVISGLTVEPGATLIAHEDFTGTLNDALDGDTPNVLDNGNAMEFSGTGSLLRDGSGAMYNNGGGGSTAGIVIDTETAVHGVEMVVELPDDTTDHVTRIIFNKLDNNNYWYVSFINFSNVLQLRKIIAGTDTQIGSNEAVTLGIGDTVCVDIDPSDNDKIYIKVNGVTVISPTITSRQLKTATKAGGGTGYAGTPKIADMKWYSIA